jgi:hypothetical protein
VRIEHWVMAQRQGQAVARTVVGERAPFTDVPFFWSQHYDMSINYVGHAERWDAIQVEGSLDQHDGVVRHREAGQVVAVPSMAQREYSEESARRIDDEARKLLETAPGRVRETLAASARCSHHWPCS